MSGRGTGRLSFDPEAVARVRRLLSGRDDVVERRMVGGLSFLAYRRLATFIRVPVAGRSDSIQSLLVDPKELEHALVRDAVANTATA